MFSYIEVRIWNQVSHDHRSHNCDDHGLLDFKSIVQYMKTFHTFWLLDKWHYPQNKCNQLALSNSIVYSSFSLISTINLLVFLQNILDATYMSSPFFHFSFPRFECYLYFFLNVNYSIKLDLALWLFDCKNSKFLSWGIKMDENDKCDQNCKKLLNKVRLKVHKGCHRLKNAEIGKHGTQSNKSDQISKPIHGS